MADPTEATDVGGTSADGLSPRLTVGIIVGISGIATVLIMTVLYALMVCKYCFFRHYRKKEHDIAESQQVRGAQFQLASPATSFTTRQYSHQNSYSSTPYGGQPRPLSSGYNVSTFDRDDPNNDDTLNSSTISTTDGPKLRPRRNYQEDDVRRQKRRTYVGSRQFPSKNLVLLTMLAEGEFGPVYRGEAYEIVPQEASRIVTVKMLKESADDTKRNKFEHEITMLSHLNHLNVVGVLGVSTDTTPECIILDGCTTHIDLLGYVRDKGIAMKDVDDGERIIQEFRELLKMADEVCMGLAYLASQHIVHKDVALRNCIRGQNRVIKVASFGIGSQIYPEAYYFLHGRTLPIRWMPPEAITHDTFSTASDIWAFGVLLWELFTYGEHPFRNLTNRQVTTKVSQHYSILPQPDKCPEDVFLIMSSCWAREPMMRPKFLEIHQHLYDLTSPHFMEDCGNYLRPFSTVSRHQMNF